MRLSKKGWVILTTLIVIASVFAFYFLVYVKDKESQIIANKIRVLTQIKVNVDLLINSEEKIRKNELSEIDFNKELGKLDLLKDSLIYTEFPVGASNLKKEIKKTEQVIREKISSNHSGWSYSTLADRRGTFFWEKDSASWKMTNNLLYKKAYPDLFGKELIEREDAFEFIAIVVFEGGGASTLYSNHPLGKINFPTDSANSQFTSKNVFEIDFGSNQYLVFSSLMEQVSDQVYLFGFVNKSQYNEEKREVSVFLITIAIMMVTLIVLALPILKLRIMSNAERLGAKDVFLAGFSLVVGPMVLILFFLLFATIFFTDKPKENNNLKSLNAQLAQNFQEELTKAVAQMKLAKEVLDPSLSESHKISQEFHCKELYDPNGEIDQLVFTDVWNSNFWNEDFKYFNSMFWTDYLGNIKIYLSSEENPMRIGSLKHRNYIMDIIKGEGIQYLEDTIAFESIRSVSDGNYEIGLGIPSGKPAMPVLASSFSLVSLMDPILEVGYGFCLFNSEGQTLFHSETKRNLNEDFLEETGGILNPYLWNGAEHFTSVRYMGKNHYMYLKKIPELDGYYLATFLDKAYTYSPNTIALNTTAEMQSVYLILLFFAYLVLFFASCKGKKLKQRIFVFYWLRPLAFSEENGSPYFKLFLTNLLVLVYLIGVIVFYGICTYSPVLILHSLLCTGLFLVVVSFFLLSSSLPENYRMHTQFGEKNHIRPLWIIVAVYCGTLLIGRLIIMKQNFHPLQLWDVLLFGLVALWLYGTHRRISNNPLSQKIPKISTLTKYGVDSYRNYKLYTTTLVVLLSVIPTFIFFAITYNMEQEIIFKQKAVHLNKQEDSWERRKSEQFFKESQGVRQPIIVPLDEFIDHMATEDSLAYALSYPINITTVNEATPGSNRSYTDWYDEVRVEFDSYGINSQGFIGDGANLAHSWFFDEDRVFFPTSDSYEVITGSIGDFQTLFRKNWWPLGLFFLLLILMIYGLIASVARKAFGLDFKEYADTLILPQNYDKIGQKLIEVYTKADERKDSYNNSFIVGVNASHVYKISNSLEEWKKECFYNVEFLDLPNLMEGFNKNYLYNPQEYFANSQLNFQIPIRSLIKNACQHYEPLLDALKDKHTRKNQSPIMVFIEHFEHAYDNELFNRIKLNLLQRLVSNPSIRVVISSEISPTKIYEFYEDSIKKATVVSSGNLDNIEKISELKSVYKQWQHLLGGFYRVTVPFDSNEDAQMPKELTHGQYLNRINNKYQALYGGFQNNDNFILNVQETSYTYYFSIWNSLTSEERYIIYDIAHDQFVNTNNVDGIIDLLHKGILVYDHSMHLMNESFTNFVLTKVDSEEALEKELKYAKRGNWSTASAVLMLVIISLIVFISLGKINILEDVNALLGSLAAIFALLLRVGGMFISGKSMKE